MTNLLLITIVSALLFIIVISVFCIDYRRRSAQTNRPLRTEWGSVDGREAAHDIIFTLDYMGYLFMYCKKHCDIIEAAPKSAIREDCQLAAMNKLTRVTGLNLVNKPK